MELKSKDDLVKLLTDLQGQVQNLTEEVDKLSPAEDEQAEETAEGEQVDETPEVDDDEVDALLNDI